MVLYVAQVAEPFAFTNSFVGTEEYLSPEARHDLTVASYGRLLTSAFCLRR